MLVFEFADLECLGIEVVGVEHVDGHSIVKILAARQIKVADVVDDLAIQNHEIDFADLKASMNFLVAFVDVAGNGLSAGQLNQMRLDFVHVVHVALNVDIAEIDLGVLDAEQKRSHQAKGMRGVNGKETAQSLLMQLTLNRREVHNEVANEVEVANEIDLCLISGS